MHKYIVFDSVFSSTSFGEGDGGGDSGGSGGEVSSAPPDGAGESSGSEAAPDSGDGGSSFNWSSWDGAESSVPDSHKEAYGAISKARESSDTEKVRSALVRGLQNKYRDQDAQRETIKRKHAEQSAGGEERALTESEFSARMSRHDQDRKRSERLENFRDGMIDLTGKIHQFGETSVGFSSEGEVQQFETWMQDQFSGKMTPKDMFKLYMFDTILKQHGDAVVRKYEGKLKGGQKIDTGRNIDPNAPAKPRKEQPDGEGRVPSLEEYLNQNNPRAGKAINEGNLNPLDFV